MIPWFEKTLTEDTWRICTSVPAKHSISSRLTVLICNPMKVANLGVPCWNRTSFDQWTSCSCCLINSYVCFVLKTGRSLSLLCFHYDWSFIVVIFTMRFSMSVSNSFKRSLIEVKIFERSVNVAHFISLKKN